MPLKGNSGKYWNWAETRFVLLNPKLLWAVTYQVAFLSFYQNHFQINSLRTAVAQTLNCVARFEFTR